jgi:predicted nucleic acid-binding protein
MKFVLDNSVCMRWLFGDGSADDLSYASYVLSLLEDGSNGALSPSIWPLEVANVIARAEAKELIGEAQSAEFTSTLKDMAIEIDSATAGHALDDTLQLARRFNFSAYDAAYLELALRRGLPLATLDSNLRGALARTGLGIA